MAGDEIQQLAETWNNMLARLEISVARMSQFTSDASHELRTPIALIRSTAEIALRRPRPEHEYREALVQIQTESERMTQLVSDLLFLARADDHAISAEMTGLDLRGPVREACAEIAPFAAAQGKELKFDDYPESLPVMGHPSSLRRLLFAILENAIKYTAPGGKITVDMKPAPGVTRVNVRDNGMGIPPSALPHIFERFFRADPSRNRTSGGYGLGLAIAQTIARQHHGLIEVQSKVGDGSAFSVTLPRYAGAKISNDSRAASTVLATSSSE
jgi:signal transduction histidine kinase